MAKKDKFGQRGYENLAKEDMRGIPPHCGEDEETSILRVRENMNLLL